MRSLSSGHGRRQVLYVRGKPARCFRRDKVVVWGVDTLTGLRSSGCRPGGDLPAMVRQRAPVNWPRCWAGRDEFGWWAEQDGNLSRWTRAGPGFPGRMRNWAEGHSRGGVAGSGAAARCCRCWPGGWAVMKRIGIFVCHCGTNIAAPWTCRGSSKNPEVPEVVYAIDYKYMCSEPASS